VFECSIAIVTATFHSAFRKRPGKYKSNDLSVEKKGEHTSLFSFPLNLQHGAAAVPFQNEFM